ncbi:hypothetical protein [Acidovorax sp. SDU_ACID1]|uniref:hypothetical protein n=1 Tax=Acidovorax sp. SDU_ACID1 TaxID=3136632 RepID=UPI0038737D15
MKLFTQLPARKDGSLIVRVPGASEPYIFRGEPLCCDVEDEDHLEYLRVQGFMSQDEYEAEAEFQRRNAEREAKRVALGLPSAPGTFTPRIGDGDEDDFPANPASGPIEGNTAPTGRVRRAARASVVTG